MRSVELRVREWRRELKAQKRATVRFETPPGRQLQIDFGQTRVWIGDERIRVNVFVATLSYSRRIHIRASLREGQTDWFEGMEGAFLRFGGVPSEVLLDNAKALVEHHDAVSREVRFNARLWAFARYWGFVPRACAPYRARTKGKDERGVGYVKKNAIAGRRFESWASFEAHLDRWIREVADQRDHGTTGEPPIERFAGEADALRRCQAVHRLDSCAISCARCRRTAPSISTRTVIPYPGVSSAKASRSLCWRVVSSSATPAMS
uniref:Mobile element protein n=1 Tax=Rhizobium leguminosarum bv. viciae TaxID=387 RepID=A0A0U3IHM6_RHILV|nr:Mobile element protein [Rhizobium leguminosarum bv. viciae]